MTIHNQPCSSHTHYHHHSTTAMTLRRKSAPAMTQDPDTQSSLHQSSFSSSSSSSTILRDTQRTRTGIFHLPFEILVGEILAILDLPELSKMHHVCKAMYQLCQTEYLWQRKFFIDFAYRPSGTLRQLGDWKRIYQAMDRVEVYTWGSNRDCRLGYGRSLKMYYESVPKRVRRLDGVGIVQLAPTGWGCHALDKHGNVWAWGRIMESNGIRSDAIPRMLRWPKNVVQLAAGRQVVLAKDMDGQIWQWCRENMAVKVSFATDHDHHHDDILTGDNNDSNKSNINNSDQLKDPVVQICAGWNVCAALTRSGKIFAWRPPQSADGRYQHRIHVKHFVCLKEQGGFHGYEEAIMNGDRFAKIAAGTDYVVAVTLMEKVFIFRRLDSPHYRAPTPTTTSSLAAYQPAASQNQDELDEDVIMIETVVGEKSKERMVEIRGRILGEGLYLPIFSEALTRTVTETYEEHDQRERLQRHRRRRQHASQSSFLFTGASERSRTWTKSEANPSQQQLRPSFSRPTTVSANFQNFALHHSSGKVLLGKEDVQWNSRPVVMERLVANACQVEFGDYHQGLLTDDGQLRTWGSFCEGALGQGDLRTDCAVPTAVEGPLKNKFVIAIGIAGWQSACLAIDMDEDRVWSTHDDLHTSRIRGPARERGKLVDDGYFSLESTSADGSSSGSSASGSASDGIDSSSSDGEDRLFPHGDGSFLDSTNSWSRTGAGMDGSQSLQISSVLPYTRSASISPSSSSISSSSSQHSALSSRCTASCALLVSSHSHRYGDAAGARPRLAPTRKRSQSMVEKYNDSGREGHRYGHRSSNHTGSHDSSKDQETLRMMALTRLNPTMTVYELTQAHPGHCLIPGKK
ncbi:hypothetical protein BGZ51_000906 [Haplosporangium sp. Z 767]|nr:hypothetical protein BGZ50_005189 [Haplosporangium sp. Z 11]KAF9188033.1 hypothetical protein BGZ51_000906 [Haplosporangium sp. Z 767]